MQSLSSLRKDRSVRLRTEYFGGLAWRARPRRIYRLDRPATAVLLLHDEPRPMGAPPQVATLGVSEPTWQRSVTELTAQGLLERVSASPIPITAANVTAVDETLTAQTPQQPVLRPFWAHLQPFTRCNQHCIHCYCFGSSKADPFLLPIPTWKNIIDRLDAYGVLDVYLTGGENLIYNDFFALAEDILSRGLGFGLSTNATVLSEATLARLRDLHIETVQVSLDGANAATHEFIRGARGSFRRTLDGIAQIAEFATVVINTVVNRQNLREVEDIVKLGLDQGCTSFKFFPQKPVGRSESVITLDDDEILGQLTPECARLAAAYEVDIETIDPDKPCGSGSLGFAIDQHADIFPCIFGVADRSQRCGNILRDDLNDVWFGSPVLERFRGEVNTPCRRCETCPARI
jgi:MoaA/NifB/PqqE/SkfB family radical SAM enzyme